MGVRECWRCVCSEGQTGGPGLLAFSSLGLTGEGNHQKMRIPCGEDYVGRVCCSDPRDKDFIEDRKELCFPGPFATRAISAWRAEL